MAGDTKERILETALELFAQNGYLGTSMNDIAQQLGFTKAALYKHYTSKQEILDRIVEHMNEMDYHCRHCHADCQNAARARDMVLYDVGRRCTENRDDGDRTNHSLKGKGSTF